MPSAATGELVNQQAHVCGTDALKIPKTAKRPGNQVTRTHRREDQPKHNSTPNPNSTRQRSSPKQHITNNVDVNSSLLEQIADLWPTNVDGTVGRFVLA